MEAVGRRGGRTGWRNSLLAWRLVAHNVWESRNESLSPMTQSLEVYSPETGPHDLERIARAIRFKLVQISHAAGTAHLGGALSCVDVLVAAYWKVLRINPREPDDALRDRFILSKGHAATALYTTLAARGISRCRGWTRSGNEAAPWRNSRRRVARRGWSWRRDRWGMGCRRGWGWRCRREFSGRTTGCLC